MKALALLAALAAGIGYAQEATVNRGSIWVDSVKRGPMVRAVRALGTVANQGSVELKVAENVIRDVRPGQTVDVDTGNSRILKGRVARIDPAVVNGVINVAVRLDQPTSVTAGSAVDGTVELERLADVLYVGRPALGDPNSDTVLFKMDADGTHATRVKVRFGRASVNTIEVLDGLQAGDRVIVSDMRAYEGRDRVRVQ
jgi:HlyD family secretion protein